MKGSPNNNITDVCLPEANYTQEMNDMMAGKGGHHRYEAT